MNTKRDYKSFDFLLAFLVISLAVLGIVLIGSATHINKDGLTSEFKGQIIWVVSGIILMLAAAFIDFQFITKFYIIFYIVNICLLIVVLIFFARSDGAPARSISFGPAESPWVSLQPSEFNKIFMIIFLSRYIDIFKDKINNLLVLGSVFILTAIPVILIQRQPSLSASLVTVVIMLVMLLVAKLHYRYILIGIAVLIPIAFILFYDLSSIKTIERINEITEITYDENTISPILIDKVMSNYQISRLKTFFNPVSGSDQYYQNQQAMRAIGSGRLEGKGLFKGEVEVPQAKNDFIFTVLAEEFGFIGCICIITAMFIVVARCFLIATRADIFYGKLIAASVGGILAFQAYCNVGVNTELLPNTGMIFPFISSGGSAMWVLMALVGLVINVGMTKTKSMFED